METNRYFLIAFAAPLLLSLLFALAMELPWLDPTVKTGTWFGMLVALGWWCGLLIFSLRVVRKHQSQFSMKTLLIIMTLVGVLLTVGANLGWHVIALFFMFVTSLGMILDYGLNLQEFPEETNKRLASLLIMFEAIAGALGLAHVFRICTYLGLYKYGFLVAS